MDSPVSPKDEIWFLRVCHHISNTVYHLGDRVKEDEMGGEFGTCGREEKYMQSDGALFQSDTFSQSQ
jgi:hypothetical protein